MSRLMVHPLEAYWDALTDPTKTVLSLAHRHSKQQGASGRLRTRYVVAALRSLQPEPLDQLIQKLPDHALPDTIALQEPPVIEPLNKHQPELSPCVRESLTELGAASSSAQSITPLALFVDLAKHGGGSTVSTLRDHGVTPSTIARFLEDLDLEPLQRS